MIDDLNLYTFVTEGDIYRMDGSEGECTDGIRQLNQAWGQRIKAFLHEKSHQSVAYQILS